MACLEAEENLSEGGLAKHIGRRFKKGYVLLYYQYSSPEFERTRTLAVWNGVRAVRAGIFKPLWSLGIDAKSSIPPAYVAWRAGTITLFLLGA